MAVDAGSSGNISRYYSVPDSAGLSLPNKDWTWLTLIRPTQTPTEVTYIISKGAYFEDQSFNLYLYPGSGLVCQVSMLGSVLSGSTLPNDKWYWAYATRRSSVLKVGYCEVGTSLSFETGSESIVNEYNSTSALNIGRRSDGDIGRYWQGRYSDTLFINGYSLTQSDVRALALGNRIEDMSFYDHVVFHAEFSSASKSYLVDKTGRYALTRNGTGWGPAEKSPTSRPYASRIDFIPSVLSVQSSIILSNQTSIVLNRPAASVLTFNIIGCTPGVISASPSAALIQVGSDVVIPGSVSAVSISSYAASIVLANDVVVSTSISSISLSQQQSNIQLGYTIASPAAALSLSPRSSVVALGNDVVISSTIKTISISPASSGIVQQSIVGAITKNILLAASQSNVLLDASVIIQANQGSLLLNSQQSGIVSNIVVNGIPVGISVSPNSSSILQSNVISSQIKNIALLSNQCSFILDNIIFGNITSLQLAIMQAGIYSGGIVPVVSDKNISMVMYKGGISMSASAKNISMTE